MRTITSVVKSGKYNVNHYMCCIISECAVAIHESV